MVEISNVLKLIWTRVPTIGGSQNLGFVDLTPTFVWCHFACQFSLLAEQSAYRKLKTDCCNEGHISEIRLSGAERLDFGDTAPVY